MKKTMHYFITAAGILLAVLLIGARVFKYLTEAKETELQTYYSDDNTYSLKISQIGEPQAPFGPGKCRLTLRRGDRTVSTEDIMHYNDGKNPGPENFLVLWDSEGVSVRVYGEEQDMVTYRMNFDGSIGTPDIGETEDAMEPTASFCIQTEERSFYGSMEESETAQQFFQSLEHEILEFSVEEINGFAAIGAVDREIPAEAELIRVSCGDIVLLPDQQIAVCFAEGELEGILLSRIGYGTAEEIQQIFKEKQTVTMYLEWSE